MKELIAVFLVWCLACFIVDGRAWLIEGIQKADADQRQAKYEEEMKEHWKVINAHRSH